MGMEGIGGPIVDQFVRNHLGPIVNSALAAVAEFVVKQLIAWGVPEALAGQIVQPLIDALANVVTSLVMHFIH
jgi:hypothetical protein